MEQDNPQFKEYLAQKAHKDMGRHKGKAADIAANVMEHAAESYEIAEGRSPRDVRPRGNVR